MLSAQQKAIVTFIREGKGSANIVARAGCGKTHTLIRGVVKEIVECDLGEVAIMAFNKSAGQEFKDRLQVLAEDTGNREFLNWKRVQAGTCHSFGFGAVRKWAPDVQVEEKKVLLICREFAAAMAPARSIYDDEAIAICKLVSLAKQSAIGYLHPIGDRSPWFDLVEHHAIDENLDERYTVQDLVCASQEMLHRSINLDRKMIDFDDMILAPLVHKLRIWPKDWVLIDEAQDTNAARRHLALKMLKPHTGRLIAVGDDRQAIYGFTGADADSLNLILEAVNGRTFPLTVTYRCPKQVVAEANRLVPDLEAHHSAPMGDVTAIPALTTVQDAASGDTMIHRHWYEGEKLTGEDAVLCRNTAPLLDAAYGMLAKGIGCRVEGREIGENLIALALKWKTPKTLGQLAAKLQDHRDKEVEKWTRKEKEDRAQAIADRCDALITICQALQSDGKSDISDLVDWIRDLFGDTKPGETPNVVTLSTIHKAKGREWTRVFLLFRNTTLPSPWARKEWQMVQETNLEYVAITRAKEELIYVD